MAEVKVKIKCPTVPNFVRDENGRVFPVSSLTDVEIKQLGKEWTARLIENAKLKRASTTKETSIE